MTVRYTIQEMPFPIHDKGSDARSHWAVTDNKPQCEEFETIGGAKLIEEKAPPFRHVAYCGKRGHAEMIASALNADNLKEMLREALWAIDCDAQLRIDFDECAKACGYEH